MRRFKIRLPSPGVVLGFLALAVALGGTAAANLPGNNTVISSDIANGHVRHPDINTGAVRAQEIRAGAVQDAELGTLVVRTASTNLADGASGRAEAVCDAGERIIGGGGDTQQSGTDAIFHGSHPSIGGGGVPVAGNTFTAWNAKASNEVGGLATVTVRAWAICLQ